MSNGLLKILAPICEYIVEEWKEDASEIFKKKVENFNRQKAIVDELICNHNKKIDALEKAEEEKGIRIKTETKLTEETKI